MIKYERLTSKVKIYRLWIWTCFLSLFSCFNLKFNSVKHVLSRQFKTKSHEDRKSTRLNSSHVGKSRMPSSA